MNDWRVPALLRDLWPIPKEVAVEGWTKIKWAGIVTLTDEARGIFAWRWRRIKRAASQGLQLVSPRGVVWDFKLQSGAWVRRATNDGNHDGNHSQTPPKKSMEVAVHGP